MIARNVTRMATAGAGAGIAHHTTVGVSDASGHVPILNVVAIPTTGVMSLARLLRPGLVTFAP